MNRDEFLNILKGGLKDFPEMELNDILYDYKEHFDAALASGKSNEEILSELGNPSDIVNQYRSGYLQKYEAPKQNYTNADYTDTQSNNNNSGDNEFKSKTPKSSDTTSQIIKVLLIICGIVFLGPVASGIIVGIIGLFIGIVGLCFGATAGGIAVLLGTTFTNLLGIAAIPTFIADFPTSVVVLITISGFLGFIFNICVIYYIIKAIIIMMKKFINWISPMIRGEL